MDDYTAVLERAIDEYGEECQIDKAIEEMSELTKAMGETLTQRRRVREEGLRIVNLKQQGRRNDGTC